MDVHHRLTELRSMVEEGRSKPRSTTVALDRGELLRLLDRVSQALDGALVESHRVVTQRDTVLAEARAEADRIVADARTERAQVLADSDVLRDARAQAQRLMAEAHAAADELRRESDDYVDATLANFEITLQRTTEAVKRGRANLAGESAFAGITPDAVDQVSLPDHLRP